MNLVAADLPVGNSPPGAGKESRPPHNARPRFFRFKHSGRREQSHPVNALPFPAFHSFRIRNTLSKHLIAAADTEYEGIRIPFLFFAACQPENGRLQPGLPQPFQILYGVFRSRQNDRVRPPQLSRPFHIPDRYSFLQRQRLKIRKIGDSRKPDDGNINLSGCRSLVQGFRQGILLFDLNIRPGHHAQHLLLTQRFQHGNSRLQDPSVPPEFVDDQPADPVPLLFFQKLYRSVQLGKHSSPVNVPHQEDLRIRQLRHSHIHDIVLLQIDLRRASRSFDHDDVVFRSERLIGLPDQGEVFSFLAEIVHGMHISNRLPVQNHLGTHVRGGL